MENSFDLFERIRQHYENLSNNQKKVAEYLLQNYENVAFLSAAKVGREIGVSESVVIRFAIALGYSGYPELQRAVQQLMKSRLAPANKLKQLIEKEKTNGLIFRKILQQDIENIKKTLESVTCESFDAVVETIWEAHRVYIVGLRALACLAEMLGFLLTYILPDIKVLRYGDAAIFEGMKDLTDKDVMIVFSFPRYTRRTIEALSYAKQCGAKTIAITDKIISPAAQVAEFVLLCEINMISFNNSYVAPMSVINALVAALSMKDADRVLASLNKMEDVIPVDVYI